MVSISFHTTSGPYLYPYSSKSFLSGYLFFRQMSLGSLNCNAKPFRIKFSLDKDSLLNEGRSCDQAEVSGNLFDNFEYVEVTGIGSRKDAALDFCLDSPFCSPALRFWNILFKDSGKVQLQQRSTTKDVTPRIVESPLAWQSCSKAIILVASAAYGSDHIAAIDILKTVKSANKISVGIILKPFGFEGRRRQDEVKDLVHKFQEHTDLCIVIDTDELLKKDMVTLDEALKTSNNAVLMAINAISVLISDTHTKFLDVPDNYTNEIKVSEVIKILKSYKETKIGFGAGYNIKASIVRAIYDCPFLSMSVKDLNEFVVCIFASSGAVGSSDVHTFLETFRQTTECMGKIVISVIHVPNLEPNIILATIITVCNNGQKDSQNGSIFSKLAQHFPFIFNFLKGQNSQSQETQSNNSTENSCFSDLINSPDKGERPNIIPVDGVDTEFNIYSAEMGTLLSNDSVEAYSLRDYGGNSEESEFEFSEASTNSSSYFDSPDIEGRPNFQREPLISWNLGPGHKVLQEWAEQAHDSVAAPVLHNLSVYKLPVGVKCLDELKDTVNISKTITEDDMRGNNGTPIMYWDTSTDAGLEEVTFLNINSSTRLKGSHCNVFKKQGVLSNRAASMLEAERDSQKKWSPLVEMNYKGGVYRGRCQGGLPEGKGCLSLGDGSIYDGLWRYGKKSGLGTFYFSNGDVFQGSWRDDLMHGKGWFYFHTGDRWFANFWKGKANGETRFYSKLGDVFFGHFKDGWRHGHFLCVNINGARLMFEDGIRLRLTWDFRTHHLHFWRVVGSEHDVWFLYFLLESSWKINRSSTSLALSIFLLKFMVGRK